MCYFNILIFSSDEWYIGRENLVIHDCVSDAVRTEGNTSECDKAVSYSSSNSHATNILVFSHYKKKKMRSRRCPRKVPGIMRKRLAWCQYHVTGFYTNAGVSLLLLRSRVLSLVAR